MQFVYDVSAPPDVIITSLEQALAAATDERERLAALVRAGAGLLAGCLDDREHAWPGILEDLDCAVLAYLAQDSVRAIVEAE